MSPSREKLDNGHPDWPGPEDDVEVIPHGSTVIDGEEVPFWQDRHGTSEVARSAQLGGEYVGLTACTLRSVRRYVITGAPGTGKTALVESLTHVGTIVGEPARELIAEHREATGEPSLDGSPGLFVERLIVRSIEKFDAAPAGEAVIYDRGLPDCVAYARVFNLDPGPALAAAGARRYSDPVFMAPPWEAIYSVDDMRRASFEQIAVFHDVLVAAYETLGYELVELPQATVAERVQIVTTFLQPTRP